MESQLRHALRHFRQQHRLTQQQLAEVLNTDQSYISRIETGDRVICDLDFLRRVSDRLKIPAEILGLSGNITTVNWNKRDPEAMRAWASIIRLAELARNSGNHETAIRELSSLLLVFQSHQEAEGSLTDYTEIVIQTKLNLA